MASKEQQNPGVVMGIFEGMPGWAKAIVFALISVPVAVAISGMILNVNVGSYLDKYMEVQLERQRNQTEAAADRIIAAFDERLTAIEEQLDQTSERHKEFESQIASMGDRLNNIEGAVVSNQARVDELYGWTCGPIMVDRDPDNDPEWC